MSVIFSKKLAIPQGVKKASDYAVGESVFLSVDGVNTEFLVIHQGNPDSSIYDASCDGTWLLMKNIYNTQTFSTSNQHYENSEINNYLNNTFLNMFNSNTQNAIKQIKLPYWYYEDTIKSGYCRKGSNGLQTKIFFLSDVEVGFPVNYVIVGSMLFYFEYGSSTSANTKRIAYLNGTATKWWGRDPLDFSSGYTDGVNEEGWSAGLPNRQLFGVRPALILNSSTKFDPDTNIIIG